MGERSIWMGLKKYNCIYDDFVKYMGKNKYTDLTYTTGNGLHGLDNLMKDCSIMNGAKAVITFGDGGSYAIAVSVSNIVSFKNNGGTYQPVESHLFGEDEYDKDGKYVTLNIKKFLNKLYNL